MQNDTSSLNSGKHIPHILKETECPKHRAPKGIPCFHILPGSIKSESFLAGLCGRRVKRAGYNGKISQSSMTRTQAPRQR